MLNSTVLDVTIGLVLIYLVLSLFCSAVKEWIARFLALRATALRQGINELLAGGTPTGLAAAIHDHPLIDALKPNKAPIIQRLLNKADEARYPSYISSQTFALAVMDLTTTVSAAGSLGGAKATLLSNLRPSADAAANAAPTPVPAVIKKILADVNGDSDLMRQRLEQWFDDSMQRVSGWYKRRTQAWLFGIGIVVAFLLNADTLTIVRQLQHDPSVREGLVKQADAIVAGSQGLPLDSIQSRIKISVDSLTQAGIGIGWDMPCAPHRRLFGTTRGTASAGCGSVGASLLGLLLTAIALSLGAPFWFDLLNKVTNVRQAGSPPPRPPAR
ncbi:MAG TPA: hypothetical protein VN600_03920 [Gemmatimonadaceae bacterium]|nr:hypothetical protein [Gemmatimonadaceae bacterium]